MPMRFLPIVERELRVAARRRFTYWIRLVAALLALLIFGGFQIIAELSKGMFFNAGQVQFSILKWLCFASACAAGLFLTADSLSEEKRDGTLGLLFLTDLRGHDVVLGKLFSNSVRSVYALLATFPILGLTLLSGGVSGGEFWRILLIICNTLFLSLSAGLLVSSVSRDSMKAMNGALLVIVIMLAGLPLADLGLAGWDPSKFAPKLSLASPVWLFSMADGVYPRNYWVSLGIQHALGWLFLALSSVCAPHAWQEKAGNANASRSSLAYRWRFGGQRFRAALRRKLLDQEPVLWLAMRDRWLPRLTWIITGLGLAWLGASFVHSGDFKPLQTAFYLQKIFAILLELWVAAQASRFFVEAVRNGAVELLLVTSAGPDRIVRSQWRAVWRTFIVPALLLVAVQLAAGTVIFLQMHKSFAGAPGARGFNYAWYQAAGTAADVAGFVGNLIAVAWFGMWMGLTTRKHSLAVLKSICFVLLLPWLGLIFIQGIFMGIFAFAKGPFWLTPLLVGGICLVKDLFFILWSRRRLLTQFRDTVSLKGFAPTMAFVAAPPVIVPPPAVVPIKVQPNV
jgi:ABC-type transport system involved in cytochrome c biogenesis permease component